VPQITLLAAYLTEYINLGQFGVSHNLARMTGLLNCRSAVKKESQALPVVLEATENITFSGGVLAI